MESYDVAIIGAGISGIRFAQQALKHKLSSVVIEKNAKPGGCIETFYPPNTPQFWTELGAHTAYNSYHHLLEYCDWNNLIKNLEIRDRQNFKLLDQYNHICSIFKQLNLIRAGIGLGLFKLTKPKLRTVSEYFSFVLGKKNYHQVLQYCFDAVLCQDSGDFPADFLFKKRHKNKKFPRSFTFKNGMSTLFSSLKVGTLNIEFNYPCQKISYENGAWYISTGIKEYHAQQLMLATPWHITQKLLGAIKHPISKLNYQPLISYIKTISLVLDKQKTDHIKPMAGLIGIKRQFYAMVSRDIIPNPNYRGFTVHFRSTEIEPEKLLSDFLKQCNIPHYAVVDYTVKDNAVPAYTKNHHLFIEGLDRALTKDNSLYLAGNYFTRLAIEDCIYRADNEINRLLLNRKY